MAVSTFTYADGLVPATRTPFYTTPGATVGIVFSGTVTNVDDTNMLDHTIVMEVLKIDGTTYRKILNKVPIPYGSSLEVPLVDLVATEKIYFTADAANVLEVRLSIVERA